MKVKDLLRAGYDILKKSGIDSYILDCQLILGKVLSKDRLAILLSMENILEPKEEKDFFYFLELRRQKMPVKYITGTTEFMGIQLYVSEGVLIPRPDTETLVEETLKLIKANKYKYICDLCTGSGAIGISIGSLSETNVSLYDISEKAIGVANKNIISNGLESRITAEESDLLELPISKGCKFDAIISNPPYIKTKDIEGLMEDVKRYEPYIALCGGDNGLLFYEAITKQSNKILVDGGMLAFEIGYDQYEEVKSIMIKYGYKGIYCVKDLSKMDRAVFGFK
ncbi:MAG TPA: peptide chain release factor N(5)-glutamine methyltransferase [Clostridiaceae bacterium]